ncbi:MAG: DEAD/DEAH box helicase, partial [Candidatus Eisenbacteria bacterium]|nr:DEAD/DEAH box helicase [Candidatus Eisenbacteria bacterium]
MSEPFDPVGACQRIRQRYRDYLLTRFSPRSTPIRDSYHKALTEEFVLTRGPYLQGAPPFLRGQSLRGLVSEGVLTRLFEALDSTALPLDRPLYSHQERAIRQAAARRNLLIATGTGSGKTECFLVPILDHLLRERERDMLESPGVRALLLYPMNALANDQVKRLRRVLAQFPDITFGRYIGETEQLKRRAEEKFRRQYPYEPRIPNELLSREEMQQAPPHLLLTNFAMLEYLLLRPADSILFDGPTGRHWRFICLDEVHIYSGAQGTEIAMLMRRLRDRVVESSTGSLTCFGTSATLGKGREDFPALAKFAEALFGEPFEYSQDDPLRMDVIEAAFDPPSLKGSHDLPFGCFAEFERLLTDSTATARDVQAMAELALGSPTVASEKGLSPRAYARRLLSGDRQVQHLIQALGRAPGELSRLAPEILGASARGTDLARLVRLGMLARETAYEPALVPARYHFLLRALEGAFICLDPEHPGHSPVLRLNRHRTCPACSAVGRPARMFELAVCRGCGAEHLLGTVKPEGGCDVLSPAEGFAPKYEFFLLSEPIGVADEDEIASSDEMPDEERSEWVCPRCAALLATSEAPCNCGSERPKPRRVTHVSPGKQIHRCAACSAQSSGDVVLRFVTGSDAAVAVVATELYQALPASSDAIAAQEIGDGRRLLSFSDSRQDAAFFAAYLDRTYGRAVERRLIARTVAESRSSPVRFYELVDILAKAARDHRVLNPDDGVSAHRAEASTWLMQEILAIDRQHSLDGTGTASILPAVPERYQAPRALLDLGFSPTEAADLILTLLETLRVSGAVAAPPGLDLRDDAFAPRNREIFVRGQGRGAGVLSWLPSTGTNRRLCFLERVFSRRHLSASPAECLDGIWRYLTAPGSQWSQVLKATTHRTEGVVYQLAFDRLDFAKRDAGHSPKRCGVCRRVSWIDVSGVCPSLRCKGELVAEEADAQTGEHYANLYRTLETIGLRVAEHTAQLASEAASEVQDEFATGRINVLSCSTTFELGVDIGEVQSVLLRNVPPSPANYVQRAGRAGRRAADPALIVTFAQMRSHDLSYFADPLPMVAGRVAVPRIALENAAIARRHVHSVAFAAFHRWWVSAEHESAKTVSDFFEAPDDAASLDERFTAWLESHPEDLKAALLRLLPAELVRDLGVVTWEWVDALCEQSPSEPSHGWFARAREEVRESIDFFQASIEDASKAKQFERAAALQRTLQTLQKRELLGFLGSRNVLPKYGFPVDVVELDLSASPEARRLDLSRDLRMAIMEYAPTARVIAEKRVWVSRGLALRPGRAWPIFANATCDQCGAFHHHIEELTSNCACGADRASFRRRP